MGGYLLVKQFYVKKSVVNEISEPCPGLFRAGGF